MQTPARPAWLALAWMCCCLPPDPPDWVIAYPITWGIQTNVVADGYYSQDLGVPPGHIRAEALPGDTVELRWFGAGPEDSEIRPPIWLLTSFGYAPFSFDGTVPNCEQPLPSLIGFCRLGEGERLRVSLGSLDALTGAGSIGYFSILAIASDGDVNDPETCLQRAFSERNPDLLGCLMATRTIEIGPDWRLLQFHPDAEDLPEQYFNVPANTNPIITALSVERSSRPDEPPLRAAPGERLTVRPGEQISVTVELDADAAQEFVVLGRGPDDTFVAEPSTETLIIEARLNALTVDYERSDDRLTHRWTAPDSPDALTFFVQVADDRGGVGFATLRLVSALEDDETP